MNTYAQNIHIHVIITNEKDVHEFEKSREWYMGGFKERKGKGVLNYNIKNKEQQQKVMALKCQYTGGGNAVHLVKCSTIM